MVKDSGVSPVLATSWEHLPVPSHDKSAPFLQACVSCFYIAERNIFFVFHLILSRL